MGPICSLKRSMITTPLGRMLAIGDQRALYLLEFVNRRALERQVKRLSVYSSRTVEEGSSESLELITHELELYFKGELKTFETSVIPLGTPFQKLVWETLSHIPLGTTGSYLDVAKAIGKPSAYRAVANAVGSNSLALIIPCHRVIAHSGALGGYAGGVERKSWLLQHEGYKF